MPKKINKFELSNKNENIIPNIEDAVRLIQKISLCAKHHLLQVDQILDKKVKELQNAKKREICLKFLNSTDKKNRAIVEVKNKIQNPSPNQGQIGKAMYEVEFRLAR